MSINIKYIKPTSANHSQVTIYSDECLDDMLGVLKNAYNFAIKN
jgi:hypothetical protein